MTVIHGDCLEVIPTLEANSIDAIVTDPPYGLSEPRSGGDGAGRRTGEAWRPRSDEQKAKRRGGFMGKAWDAEVPGIEYWEAGYRVAKPGSYLVAFGGTRTYHRLTVAIEDAGWEIRDCLSYLYGSGFPKSHNGAWGGTALKPAWEPIILARKPLVGTVAKNVEQHGTGGLNIDGCRIGTGADKTDGGCAGTSALHAGGIKHRAPVDFSTGRWPANVVLDEEAAAELDAQTGTLKSGDKLLHHVRTTTKTRVAYGEREALPEFYPGDSGGASRFFYTSKAGKAERSAGLHEAGLKATHPTVKPLDLMQWLCRLVTPKGGLILDPFCGSGTTGRAAVAEGFRFVGIEKEAEYVEIARARIAEYAPLFSDGAA